MTIVEFGCSKVNDGLSSFLGQEFKRVDLDGEIMIIFILSIFNSLLLLFLGLSL